MKQFKEGINKLRKWTKAGLQKVLKSNKLEEEKQSVIDLGKEELKEKASWSITNNNNVLPFHFQSTST